MVNNKNNPFNLTDIVALQQNNSNYNNSKLFQCLSIYLSIYLYIYLSMYRSI